MADKGFEDKCVRDYEWTMQLLAEYLGTKTDVPGTKWSLRKQHVCTIDVMRCDLAAGYGKTAEYFFAELK
eukprot:gene35237-29089_t